MNDGTAMMEQRSIAVILTAREHPANERTFLAWIRTALALMGFGVLVARLRWITAMDYCGSGPPWRNQCP